MLFEYLEIHGDPSGSYEFGSSVRRIMGANSGVECYVAHDRPGPYRNPTEHIAIARERGGLMSDGAFVRLCVCVFLFSVCLLFVVCSLWFVVCCLVLASSGSF